MLFICRFHFTAFKKQLTPFLPTKFAVVRNESGQGLIEYLVIVALMGVATIAIVRVMGQTVESKFGNIAHALNADHKVERSIDIDASYMKKKDLGNFMEGSSNRSKSAGGAGESSRPAGSSPDDGQQ